MEDDGYEVVTIKKKEVFIEMPIAIRANVDDKGYIKCPTEWRGMKVNVSLKEEDEVKSCVVEPRKVIVRGVKGYKQFPYKKALGMSAQNYAKDIYDRTGSFDEAFEGVYQGMYSYLKANHLFGKNYTLDRLRFVTGQIIYNLKDSMNMRVIK